LGAGLYRRGVNKAKGGGGGTGGGMGLRAYGVVGTILVVFIDRLDIL